MPGLRCGEPVRARVIGASRRTIRAPAFDAEGARADLLTAIAVRSILPTITVPERRDGSGAMEHFSNSLCNCDVKLLCTCSLVSGTFAALVLLVLA